MHDARHEGYYGEQKQAWSLPYGAYNPVRERKKLIK